MSSPAILTLRATGLLARWLRCRRNGQGRWVRLLPLGLLFTKTLLLASLTLQVLLALSQAVRKPGSQTAGVVPAPSPARVSDDPASWGKVGRNEPCPCGSGKKYKHCHGRLA